MAVLFEKQIGENRYRVTKAGRSIRLYTNGLFHSQYNANSVISGALWDLLLLPGFMLPQSPRHCLVLGVGGGAVIRMLQHFFPAIVITGVDIDRTHVTVAKRYFGISRANTELVVCDAKQWLSENNGLRFDMVIDDVFGGQNGDPQRPFEFDRHWLAQLLRAVSKTGCCVINLDRKEYVRRFVHAYQDEFVRHGVMSAWQMACPGYENRIMILNKAPVKRAEFTQRLQQSPKLDVSKKSCRLQFKLTRCWQRV